MYVSPKSTLKKSIGQEKKGKGKKKEIHITGKNPILKKMQLHEFHIHYQYSLNSKSVKLPVQGAHLKLTLNHE